MSTRPRTALALSIAVAAAAAIGLGGTTSSFAATSPHPGHSNPAAPSAHKDRGGNGQGPVTPVTGTTGTTRSARSLMSPMVSAPTITRSQVLSRADSWVNLGLSYDQSGSYAGYRTDCSGYASMAWHLDASLDTTSFVPSGVASWISKGALKAGDALLNDSAGNAGHIVVFDHWADSSQSSYVGYEFTGSGVHHRTIPYPYYAGYGTFSPVHNNSVVDDPTSPPPAPAPDPALGDKGSVLGLGTSPTAYTFTRDALTGHLQVTTLGPGGWATKDLTSSVGTPVSAGGAPAAFVQQGGTVGAVTADAANGHLQITYLSTAGAWATADLTASVGTPVTGGALSTAIAPDGTLYIFSRGSTNSGHLSATYLSGTGGGWATADMTTMVGTPASAGGAPSTFLQTNGTLGVATADAANGHLQITYLPKGGAWATSDLTASVGTPVTGGYTSNLIAPDGTLYIFSRGSTNGGHLSATYLNTSGTWATADMTNQVGTPASAGGAPSTFLQTNGTLGVATADAANGHLQITYLPKGGNWTTSDLTTQAGTPVTGGAVSAMTDADGTLAIYSIGSTNNGDVQLTYLPTNGTWTTVSMTTTAGTPHAG
ncbi:hypothetical protein ABIA33_004704 [Streptacidiphilus sp. MAP12-16]|uniref:hypothetical protein n=1 Tax=Streptacidiphilus sp. MAP12-16 TaxID=3156300 RepID=UPI0035159FCB